MKTEQERGPVGAWLRYERGKRGWSVDDVVRAMAEKDYPVLPAYYRTVEAGPKRPGPAFIATLVSVYGTEPEEADPDEGRDPLLVAIERLTDAIERQTLLLARLAGDRTSEGSRPPPDEG